QLLRGRLRLLGGGPADLRQRRRGGQDRRGGGDRPGGHGGGRSALPVIKARLAFRRRLVLFGRLRRGGVIEDELRLFLVPGESGVAALAGAQRLRRAVLAGRHGIDAAVGRLLRLDGEDEGAAVFGEAVLGHVGEGAFLAVAEVAQDEFASQERRGRLGDGLL